MDGNVFDIEIIFGVERDNEDHTLDLTKFYGYIYFKPIKQPYYREIEVYRPDIQNFSATKKNI